MDMTKEEFKIMLMLYALRIDGKVLEEEIDAILEKTDGDTYRKAYKQFNKMCDAEILDIIRENKDKFAASEEDQQMLIANMTAVISADDNESPMESRLIKAVTKILKS